ncbi:MAG: winged helix-turn-helix transcriptional regulator [Xanthomonadales bacterium]|nr:winged helix-turn-helix transcriptional regulator [Xanthomonadales bacterium]
MAELDSPLPRAGAPGVRLPGIELDLEGHRLLVDGRQRACSQRAMALLALLHQRPGRVWPRGELLDALWPGGQVVADEALSQLVFRLRAALGPRGDCIVTVRGVGVRLDATSELVPAREPVPDPPPAHADGEPRVVAARDPAPAPPALDAVSIGLPAPAAASGRKPGSPAMRTVLPLVLVLALIVLVLAAALLRHWRAGSATDTRWMDLGLGVQTSDLGDVPAEVKLLVAEAFEQERQGDRARARALMEAAHGSSESPLPALILVLWTLSIDDGSQGQEWLARATQRERGGNAYLLLLENYVRAESEGRPLETIRHAGALLDLRPQAWFLRLARAHLYGSKGLRELALEELRGITADDLRHPRLAMAIADLAAYGDIAAARARLASHDAAMDTPELALARARIDWTDGNLVGARAGLVRAAQLGRSLGRLDVHDRGLAYAGLLDLIDDRPGDALPLLERSRAGARDRRATGLELDLTLLLAHGHAALGHSGDLRLEMEHAIRLARSQPSDSMADFVRLVALRLTPDLDSADAPDSEEPGATSLIDARRALARGDADLARIQVDRAVAQGSLEARLAEETRLLRVELGLPAPAGPPLHPPHPPLTRFVVQHLADGWREPATAVTSEPLASPVGQAPGH